MPSFALPPLLSSLLSSLGVPAKAAVPVEAIALLGFLSVLSLAALFKRLFFSGPLRLLTDPELWVRLPLVKREEISPDTRRFTFKLPLSYMVLGLPVGQHISFRHEDGDGNVAVRSYTPTTGDEVPGQVSFVIKVYFGEGGVNANARFPEGGKMTQ
ncbi:hypothetical protein TeGR_g13941 [Tetraparma gracilis]|uniref:FAD-binding FR-type domain-containing protein n=1 Tax=Tetraparma gracilis TaxID=2962635 RepID=A0ABQ6MH09_9STRA|nr:hypothetical protein TeGR_g13941 [Tetraparma gracilis]